MSRAFIRAAMVVGCSLMAGGAFADSNLATNGDFSSPNQNGSWGLYNSISGWNSGNGLQLEVGTSTIYGLACANAACQNLEVNSTSYGNVYQTLTNLTVGGKYLISYLYGGRTSGGPSLLDVSFGGEKLTTNSGSIGSWMSNSFVVTATSSSEVLRFASQVSGASSFGNEITNVRVTAVPGPQAGAGVMSALALLGLGALLRNRRQGLV